MEGKGNAGQDLFLHFEAFQFFSAKLSISFLPSYPFLFCQATYFCKGGAKAPPPGTPMPVTQLFTAYTETLSIVKSPPVIKTSDPPLYMAHALCVSCFKRKLPGSTDPSGLTRVVFLCKSKSIGHLICILYLYLSSFCN